MLNQNKLNETLRLFFLIITILTLSSCDQNISEQQMLSKAKTYLNENKPKAAALELRNVLQKNNKNAEARFLLGNINLNIGDFKTAEKEFKRAKQAGWDQQETQLALARIYITTGEHQKLLNEIIPLDNWAPETHANITALRALAEANLNKPKLAKSSLNNAKDHEPLAFQVLKTTAIFQLANLSKGDVKETLKLALSQYPDNAELLLLLASYNIQNDKQAEAANLYKKIISQQPPNLLTANAHKARISLARIQISEKKLDEAVTTLAPLLKTNSKNPEANYLNGLISFIKKDYSHAEDLIRKVLTIMPDHISSHLLMGKIKYTLQEFEQASHHLSQYLKTTPNDKSARILLTQTYIEQKKAEQARSALQPLLNTNPDEVITQSLLSRIAFLSENINEGIAALKKAINLAPNNISLQKQLAKAYITIGNTKQALKTLNKLQAPQKNSSEEIQRLTISAYLRGGNKTGAINVARKMLDANPENAEIITLNGSLQAADNNHTLARKYFNKALNLHKNLPSATIGLARLEEKEGNLDNAIALYTKLFESNKGGIVPMLALSELSEKQKRTKDMLSWLEKARTTAPQDLKSRMILANYYLYNSQPGKANIYIQEALKISPEHPELLTLHGRKLMAQTHYSEALSPLKKLTSKHPDSIRAQLLLGETLLHLGKTKEARKHLQAALKIQPNHLLATLLMAEAEFNTGNYNQSLKYAKNAQKTQPEFSSSYIQEGNVWLARQNYKRARTAYAKAWKRQPTADLAKRLFITSKHVVTFDKAIEPLLSWLNHQPDDYKTRLFLASIYQAEKQDDNAIQEYKNVLKQAPNSSAALNNLAWYYSLQNKPEALDFAERAYRTAPENAGIQDTYGWILTQQGEAEKGLRLLKLAIQTLPDNMEVRFHLASALIKSGEKAQGKQMLKELLKKNEPFEGKEQATQLLQNTSE